nr:transposase [Acidithiobacillus caldus]
MPTINRIRRQKDVDASWTKKHGKSHHGYKFTVSLDRKHKFVRTWIADTAKVHDSQHLEAVLGERNTSAEIYADKEYVRAEREERLWEQDYSPHKRKAKKGKTLSACQERRNRRIAKVRAGRSCLCCHHPVGREVDPHHRSGPRHFPMGMMVIVYNMRRLDFLGA